MQLHAEKYCVIALERVEAANGITSLTLFWVRKALSAGALRRDWAEWVRRQIN